VPDLTTALPPPDVLAQIPAVALFVERAQARRADFALTAQQAPLVAQLAVQLDGLPLALELAAARLDALPLATIVRLLGAHLQLLRWEAPDLPARQRSLEAAVGWSYELLSDDERRLFRCLGVFAGRVSLDAVAAVAAALGVGMAGAQDEADTRRALEGLASLAEKSLVLTGRPDEEDGDPEPAFGMLETVREYAQERLAAEGELAAARRAHAHSFLALAERADPLLRGRDQRAWYWRLEREQDNLRAALRWLLDQDGPDGSAAAAERQAGLQLAGALGDFWWRRGYYAEGRCWLEEALDSAPAEEGGEGPDPAVRIRALVPAGGLLVVQGEVVRARAVLEEALALAEQRQDPAATAQALTYLGLGSVIAGDVAEGIRRVREARRRWETLGAPYGLGLALLYLGYAADAMGDTAAAAAHYAAALQQFGAAGDAHLAGFVHCFLGVVAWKRGELPAAVAQVQAGLQTSLTFRDRWLLSIGAHTTVALVGDRAEPARCARLLGATDALAQATGATTFVWESVPAGQDVLGLRERLKGEGDWGATYREGRALAFGEIAGLALSLLEEVTPTLPHPETAPGHTQQPEQPPQHADRNPLSAREREVLRLVAQGRSSKAIGQQLFLSPSMVNHHLTSIFHKLGVETRAQAVAVAAQRGVL
jgi:predicted ATPase/DNA-binding CsgD family transcriptional regulator